MKETIQNNNEKEDKGNENKELIIDANVFLNSIEGNIHDIQEEITNVESDIFELSSKYETNNESEKDVTQEININEGYLKKLENQKRNLEKIKDIIIHLKDNLIKGINEMLSKLKVKGDFLPNIKELKENIEKILSGFSGLNNSAAFKLDLKKTFSDIKEKLEEIVKNIDNESKIINNETKNKLNNLFEEVLIINKNTQEKILEYS